MELQKNFRYKINTVITNLILNKYNIVKMATKVKITTQFEKRIYKKVKQVAKFIGKLIHHIENETDDNYIMISIYLSKVIE